MKLQKDNREFICDLVEYLSIKNNIDLSKAYLLDFGCGAPKSLFLQKLQLREVCKNLYGVDVYPTQESQKRLNMNIEYIKPYEEIPFQEKFDLIISNQVFEHIENIEIIYKQLFKKLKKGGLIIAGFPTKEIILEPHIKLPLFHRIKKQSFFYNLYLKIAAKFNLGSFSEFKNNKLNKKKYLNFRKSYMDKSVHYLSLKQHLNIINIYFTKVEDISDYYCKFSRGKKRITSLIKKIVSEIYPRSLRLFIIHRLFGIYIVIKK